MKHPFRRLAAAALCFCLLPCRMMTEDSSASAAAVVDYTASASLTEKITEIMNGDCNLYLSADQTAPASAPAVGTYLNNSQLYYAFTDDGQYATGKQCYIYAQAVYAKLFGEIVYHGATSKTYQHSTQVMGYTPALTAELMRSAQIMPGAYLRTTANIDGSYNGSAGHSLIILGYTDTDITVLDANADGRGLIRCDTMSYDAFNSAFLTGKGRYVSHVVQPIAAYYESVYGLTAASFAEVTDWEVPTIAMHRTGGQYQLSVPDAAGDLVWTSSDPDVAFVDELGNVTTGKDGTATVTAEGAYQSYAFDLSVEAIAWEEVGDSDENGRVDSVDAMIALEEYVKTMMQRPDSRALSDTQYIRADANDDGIVDLYDAYLILNYYVYQHVAQIGSEPEVLWNLIIQ